MSSPIRRDRSGGPSAPWWWSILGCAALIAGGLLAAVLMLAGGELVLRMLDVGGERGYFADSIRSDGTHVLRLAWNPQMDVPMPVQPQRECLSEKPAGTFRIFVVGESSAEGVPYGPEHSFSAWLARRLSAEAPEVRWEVVNAAVAGATSRSMLAMARDIAGHQPDLLVVYLGHNEMGGHLTANERRYFDPDVFTWRFALARSRLYRFLARLLPARAKRLDLRVPIGNPSNFASDADRDVYARLYRSRLETMVDLMRDAGAQTALLTLSENFSEWEPVVSVHREGLSDADLAAWEVAVAQGDALAPADCDAALAAWRRALAVDDAYADLHFQIAGCLRQLGHLQEAFAEYRLASDLDRFTQGAYTSFNVILRVGADEKGAWFVDVDAALARESGARLVGFDLFVDAMHPNLRAHQVIAETVADRLRAEGTPIPADRWNADAYTDPDVASLMQADPEIRVHELMCLGICCIAARRPCARESLAKAARLTTSAATREALERGLQAGQTSP